MAKNQPEMELDQIGCWDVWHKGDIEKNYVVKDTEWNILSEADIEKEI